MLTRYVPKVCFIYVNERIFIYFSAALTNVEDILQRNNQWKKKELKKLSETVQHKIHAIQVSFYSYSYSYKKLYLYNFVCLCYKSIK